MKRVGLNRRKARELGLLVVLIVVVEAARRWLPYDGWGQVLRWGIAILTTTALVLGFIGLVVSAVQEFRRGFNGDRESP